MIPQSTPSSIPAPLDPALAGQTPADEAKRRTRKRWIWILVGLGVFTIGALVSLGIVATLIVPNVLQKYSFASRKKAEADILAIGSALREFAIANGGKYPDSLQWLVTPDVNGQSFLDMRHVPKDPWGNEYGYEPVGPGQPHPRVISFGKDRRPGGEGDDADLVHFVNADRAHLVQGSGSNANEIGEFRFAPRTKAEADILAIDSALKEFAIANGGKFPDSLQWLVTPDVNGQSFLDMNHIPKDPWGHEYSYALPSPGHPHPNVISYGRDGRPGGEGDDADMDSLSIR